MSSLGMVPGAIDCGEAIINPKSDDEAQCGIRAFAKGHAFYLLYYYRTFGERYLSDGVAGDAEGNVVEVAYDSNAFLRIAFPKRSKFFDGNRLVTTACIKPIVLIKTEGGELACAIPFAKQESAATVPRKPVDTTICEILKSPYAFNDKLVRVRGNVSVSSEYSTIDGDTCSDKNGIWFVLGGGSSPPGLVATIAGGAHPGAEDAEGRIIPPFEVRLVRDSNFRKFDRLLRTAVKADERDAKSESGEYVFHQVVATFIGRIDGVSPEIHAFHMKRTPTDKLDYLGFGQAGQFDAQLVVKSVEGDSVLGSVRFSVNSSKTK
ncbi:MAG TPA: hypothetical protein VGR84_02165 [Candidatus Acidoferrales bacterium]|nr:hypothetical protein [Candidatus Acidoferrales bacterium]